jgi:putative ABC transport system permease protein
LRIGDQFRPAHGVEAGLEGDDHAEVHTVVGILRPSATPFDNAVFTTVNSVIAMHAEALAAPDSAPTDNHAENTDHAATEMVDAAADAETAHHDEEAHADDDHAHAIAGQVTAVLVAPVGFIEANQLWRDFYTGTEAQAVFPGRELGGLFDLLNQGQEILILVGYLAAVMAALTLFLAIYSATESRQHLLAILRGVGASRRTVMLVVLVETVLVAMIGALLGRLLGYAVAAAIAGEISRRSAILVAIGWLPQVEPVLWLLPFMLGVLAGLLPAWQAYRVNVVEKLFPS